MTALSRIADPVHPAIRRLAALAQLDAPARAALAAAALRSRSLKPGRELLAEGARIANPLLILDGWAARARFLTDGRRQIMSLLLPGDLIGNCHHSRPLSVSTIVALSPLIICAAPSSSSPSLDEAYHVSHALDEAYLLAQITRLGRLSAEERLADLMLELRDRLSLCGLVSDGGFAWPLTQSALADALGLTPVHVNRTLQQLRRRGDVILQAGRLQLTNPADLIQRVGHNSPRVTSA
ncbi:MAG TPA: Crp/Fnr family transcriptional regulator [Sphingobium sp.]|nr:Crp/Fnr family transcriptional regulator [Sphingobium sp.]